MRIVVLGAGSVGSHIVEMLADEGHDILVIEQEQEILQELIAENDVMGLLGDGTDPSILQQAEVGKSDFFIGLAADDEVNIVAANMAKVLGVANTIARVRSPKYEENRHFMTTFMGIDNFINPEYLSAREIELTLGYSKARSVENFFNDRIQMIQFVIEEESKFLNKSIKELSQSGLLDEVLITIIDRGDELIIPSGDEVIRLGDSIHVVGTPQYLHRIYDIEFDEFRSSDSVFIVGSNRISYYLAKALTSKKIPVKILEANRDDAIRIQEAVPDAVVIHADGSNPLTLEEENFEIYSALVALTGIDERNILIALLAEKADIEKVITRVDNDILLRITGILDIDVTVTPIKEAANTILRLTRMKDHERGYGMLGLYLLENNQVEAIEFAVVKGSLVAGKKIADLNLKTETILAFIHRVSTGEVFLAQGDSSLRVGDRVVVVSKHTGFSSLDDILEEE